MALSTEGFEFLDGSRQTKNDAKVSRSETLASFGLLYVATIVLKNIIKYQ